MTYVLDSSVAVKWVVPEANSATALRLRDEARSGLNTFLAPDIFPNEVAHALTRAERQGRISVGEAATHWATVMTDSPALLDAVPLLPRAISISSAFRVGVYDCVYVALAEREGCEFVTADAKLITNLGGRFPFILDLAAL